MKPHMTNTPSRGRNPAPEHRRLGLTQSACWWKTGPRTAANRNNENGGSRFVQTVRPEALGKNLSHLQPGPLPYRSRIRKSWSNSPAGKARITARTAAEAVRALKMRILLAHNSPYYPAHGGGDKSNRLLMEALAAQRPHLPRGGADRRLRGGGTRAVSGRTGAPCCSVRPPRKVWSSSSAAAWRSTWLPAIPTCAAYCDADRRVPSGRRSCRPPMIRPNCCSPPLSIPARRVIYLARATLACRSGRTAPSRAKEDRTTTACGCRGGGQRVRG